jgi:membrane protein YdbS with pleckstrin-like domain
MENFTNNPIDVSQLPQFETITYQKLEPAYWKVVFINLIITFLVLGIGLGVLNYFIEETQNFIFYIWGAFVLVFGLIFLFSRIGFKKKGFAFREHDVLYQYGVIATDTIIIPYNRVQHVSLHEGWLSRYFGLAKIEVFTAGGSSSDIKIPGIEKEQAEKIKQLLMGKIQQKN